ncbi:MAG: hypothetical protein QXW35_04515 [Candidatus Aenigmatarchaeota archaeon]
MDERLKFGIDNLIKEIKNDKEINEFYKETGKKLDDLNNILHLSLFRNSILYANEIKYLDRQTSKMMDHILEYLENKDNDMLDIIMILFLTLFYIFDTNPELKEACEYFNKKLSEEGLI